VTRRDAVALQACAPDAGPAYPVAVVCSALPPRRAVKRGGKIGQAYPGVKADFQSGRDRACIAEARFRLGCR